MMNNNYEMIDVTDSIIPEENQKYFNDEESIELYNTCIHLMEEFITDNPTLVSEPDFEDIFDENIQDLMHSHFDLDIFYTDDVEDEMEDIIEHAKKHIYTYFMPPRSYPDTIILDDPDIDFINEQIDVLRKKPQLENSIICKFYRVLEFLN